MWTCARPLRTNPFRWTRSGAAIHKPSSNGLLMNRPLCMPSSTYRVGKDADLAADVLQSSFADALGRLAEFDPERGGMDTWLRLLARNHIRKAVKDKKRHIPLEAFWDRIDQQLGAIYSQIDAAEFPDEVLERAETRQLVNVTFANLPEAYQDVLNAKYIEELTLESIARDRDTTIDAVKAQLRRARAAFRESFLTLIAAEA